jgi:hypothetical protein
VVKIGVFVMGVMQDKRLYHKNVHHHISVQLMQEVGPYRFGKQDYKKMVNLLEKEFIWQ